MTDRIRIPIEVASEPRGQVLVLPLSAAQFEQAKAEGGGTLPAGAREKLAARAALSRFAAEAGTRLATMLDDGRLLLTCGLGRQPGTRQVAEAVAGAAEEVPADASWSVVVPELEGFEPVRALEAAADGAAMVGYRFKRSAQTPPPLPGRCTLVSDAPEARAVVERTRAMAGGGVVRARFDQRPGGGSRPKGDGRCGAGGRPARGLAGRDAER